MATLTFLVQLAGATMLLLYAVRMVRTGIERAFGAGFRRAVMRASNPFAAAATGLVMAMVLQSSAAVVLLVSGFAGSGTIGFAAGLSMALGADLGSAMLVQILSLDLEWLAPVLLAAGGLLFLKTERRSLRQAGRIVLGIAFILIALRFLRETMEPIRDSGFLPAIASYLERDYVTGFLAGTALAFVLHSSLATILMTVTVVTTGALPLGAGISLLLGANLGSALIPLWLTRGMEPAARRIPTANALLRGLSAIAALVIVNRLQLLQYLPQMSEPQALVSLHILFNAALLLMLPFAGMLRRPATALIPDIARNGETPPAHLRSVLDPKALATPQLALANLRREVLRMLQLVEEMFAPVMTLFANHDRNRLTALRKQDHHVNATLDGIRRHAASLPGASLSTAERKELRELLDYAISVEAAGDIIVRNLLPLAQEKADGKLSFSPDGQAELEAIHARVLANIGLASNVLIAKDAESARLLLEEKDEMRRLHRETRKKHLNRLSAGNRISLDSSDVHLETAHAIKEFNTQIVSVAYPILFREGQLLDTRLITRLDDDEAGASRDG